MANDKKQPKASNNIIAQVADRIKNSDNVLVALSKNPSIDELTAALGLTMMIDKMGKHSTAIFSGQVPNIIEFLEPEKTFEVNTNSLRDFIIALDKEKADHLRYKVEGDYVKVFITPYKTTIDESDMEFSHGDYNVDLVIALNVGSTADLDAALSEYGRIMHDASSINISAAAPGKFGDIEWGNPGASSVSEMICQLGDELSGPEVALFDKAVSTALLAGIFSATNRFSNERTSSDTLQVAARLMANGADQQLISSNVPVDILTQTSVAPSNNDGEMEVEKTPEGVEKKEEVDQKEEEAKEEEAPAEPEEPAEPVDPTNLTIRHGAVDFSHLDKKEEKAPVEEKEPTPEEKEKQRVAKEEAAKIIADREKEAAEKEAAKKEAAAKAAAEKEAREKEQKERDEAVRKEIEERIAKRNTTSGIVVANENDPVIKEKKSLDPIGSDVKPPIPPRDYSAMMAEELKTDANDTNRLSNILMGDDSNVVAAPVNVEIPEEQPPLSAPVMPRADAAPEAEPIVAPASVEQVQEEPISAPVIASSMDDDMMTFEETPINAPRAASAPAPVETQPVDMLSAPVEERPAVEEAMPQESQGFNGLPMPDGTVLPPPPPLPFDNFASTIPDGQPTAEQFAQQIQDTNPVMQSSNEQVEPIMPQPVDMSSINVPAAEAEPVVEMPAPAAQPEPLPVSQGSAVAMQEQVYPVDPGTFRIPGM